MQASPRWWVTGLAHYISGDYASNVAVTPIGVGVIATGGCPAGCGEIVVRGRNSIRSDIEASTEDRIVSFNYQPRLDGIRTIAVICVLVFHGGLPPRGGFLGVDVFFVLSGYLITVLLLVEVRRTGTIRLRRFYTRRAIRLLPALCVMLGTVVTVAIITLPATSKHEVLLTNIYGLLYVANWAEVAGVPMGPLGHLWSLALEEQFYLVWPPTLMWLLRRRNSAFRFLLAVVGAITVWRSFLVLAGAPWDYLYYASDVRFDGLLVGCLLGVMIWDRLDVDRSSWC